MRRAHRLLLPWATFLLLATNLQGQVATGTPPFGSFSGGPDVVNNANLNVHVSIPVRVKAGRGVSFSYVLSDDSSVWYPVTSGPSKVWTYVSNWGWRGVTQTLTGYITYDRTGGVCKTPLGQSVTYDIYSNWRYSDSFGAIHFFNLTVSDGNNPVSPLCPYDPSVPPWSSSAATNDGSGYWIEANGSPSATAHSRSGSVIHAPLQASPASGTFSATDTNGNQISVSASSGTSTFTDPLGTTALTASGAGTPSSPTTFTWTNPNSGSSSITLNYTAKTVETHFGCSGITDYGRSSLVTQNLVTSVTTPDGTYSITYEATLSPNHAGAVTGRIYQVTLPTGGTVTYQYSGGSGSSSTNAITCADGSAATLTRTTPDGTWKYEHTESGTAWTTTVTDPVTPQGNQTKLQFQTIYETQRDVYQGAVGGTLLMSTSTCYNGNLTNCNTTAVNLPITQRTVTTSVGGLQSKTDNIYNSYGLPTKVDEYAYGSGAPGGLVRKTVIAYASLGNNIVDRPSSITVYKSDGVTVAAQTTLSYDQTAVTATSGTPQHVAISGSRGNLTTATYTTQGTSTISRTSTYFDTGLVQTATDVNAAQTTYTYNSTGCANSLLTSISLPLPLSRSMVWNCTGGVATSVTDENTKTTSFVYNDPNYWRLKSITDPASAVTNISYFTSPFASESTLNFNGTTSTVDSRTTLDGLGRAQIVQRRQAQGLTSYDSVETDYDSVGRPYRVTVPYTGTAGQTNTSGPWTTTTYDALGRVLQVTDAGGGWTKYTYNQNDVLVEVGPAATGESTKKRQLEYDALGRLASVCEVTSGTGSGNCGQTSSQTGYWTKYTYDTLNNLLTVTQNAQSANTQTRTFTYDMLGRLTSATTPEANNVAYNYTYDTDAACGTSNGDLVKRADAFPSPNTNVTCYTYDSLHRLKDVTYPSGSYASVTAQKHFVYDGATVNSVVMSNAKARLAEAYTGTSASKITDLGFSYSLRGEVADLYQNTPNSAGYYHAIASYWANGLVNVLKLQNTAQTPADFIPPITYAPEGEGRANTVSAATGQNPVTGTAYNDLTGRPTSVTVGSSDSDAFTYDSKTGRMTQYNFTDNGSSGIGHF